MECISQGHSIPTGKSLTILSSMVNWIKSDPYLQVFSLFVPLLVACTFELFRKDSSAEQTMAALTIFSLLYLVAFSIYRILWTGRTSEEEFGTPVYYLYTDDSMLQ